jgi:ribosomal protein S27AE
MIEVYGRKASDHREIRAAGPFTAKQVREMLAEHRDLGLDAMCDLRQLGCPDFIFNRALARRAETLRRAIVATTTGKTDSDRRAFAAKMSQAIAADDTDPEDDSTMPSEYLGQTVQKELCQRCGRSGVKSVGPDQFYCGNCGSADPYKKRGN